MLYLYPTQALGYSSKLFNLLLSIFFRFGVLFSVERGQGTFNGKMMVGILIKLLTIYVFPSDCNLIAHMSEEK